MLLLINHLKRLYFQSSVRALPAVVLFAFLLLFHFSAKPEISKSLLSAIEHCDYTAVEETLKATADINAMDPNGANALMWAAYHCDLRMVKLLVYYGAKPVKGGTIELASERVYFGSLQ